MFRFALLVILVAACSWPGAATEDAGDDMPVIDGSTIDTAPGPDAPLPDADLDFDDDGVLDAIDNCVAIPNPLQRDHDADLRGDECDLCPHLNTASDPDGDMDGVGDACDPRDGPDVRTLWVGFYDAADIAGWTGNPTEYAVTGGVLRRTNVTGTANLVPPGSVHNPYAATSVTVTGISPGSGSRWAGVTVAATGGTQFYSCYGYYTSNAGGSTLGAYYGQWNGGITTTFDSTPFGAAIGPGTTFTAVDWITAAGGNCEIRTPTLLSLGTTSIGPRDGATALILDDYSADFDYLFVVSLGD